MILPIFLSFKIIGLTLFCQPKIFWRALEEEKAYSVFKFISVAIAISVSVDYFSLIDQMVQVLFDEIGSYDLIFMEAFQSDYIQKSINICLAT